MERAAGIFATPRSHRVYPPGGRVCHADHWHILFRIYLPLSLPSLATISLFSAVGHWNAWFDGIVFMRLQKQWSLQSLLYARVTNRSLQWATAGRELKDPTEFMNVTGESLAAAFIVIVALPVMMVYPFMQRYFVTGLPGQKMRQARTTIPTVSLSIRVIHLCG